MSANRSPTRLGEPIDDDTTITTPQTVMPIAIQVRRFVRSPKNTRPTTAAMIGDAATITTTFATSVRDRMMKQTWLTPKGSRPWQAHGRGPERADDIATLHDFLEGQLNRQRNDRDEEGHRPAVDVGEPHEIESVETNNMPSAASTQPRCRPSITISLGAQRLGEGPEGPASMADLSLSSPISANVRPSPSAGTNTGS